ncbi:MAG: hypothetical protein AYL32_010670 [Candidatus Bathyarchaeota archaeon B26-2]|nr:MAG: hypothetical protein AYL32_010670 [Candidatus Bathyarchaeota archaeon B26-2]
MRRGVKAGKTLLIDGPASITIISGKASVLGAPINPEEKVLVRYGKRMPLLFLEDSELEISLGDSASITELDGDTVPQSWKTAAHHTLSKSPRLVLVMGGVDSGKTSLCTYLANLALLEGRRVATIDGDLGQSDIGPPATVGFSLLEKPVTDLFGAKPHSMIFIGSTSPSRVCDEVVETLTTLSRRAQEAGADLTILNTDGWVSGENAVEYKVRLVENLSPEIVLALEENEELSPILSRLKNPEVLRLKPPETVKKRSREVRKALREMAYKRYLRGAKIRVYNLNWVKLEGDPAIRLLGLRCTPDQEKLTELKEALGITPIRYSETQDKAFLLLDGCLSEETFAKLESHFKKPVVVVRRGDESGRLLGLKDSKGNLLGIGILCNIDPKRRVMRVYTRVTETVSSIQVGEVKLNTDGKEIEYPASSKPLKPKLKDTGL